MKNRKAPFHVLYYLRLLLSIIFFCACKDGGELKSSEYCAISKKTCQSKTKKYINVGISKYTYMSIYAYIHI